MDGATMESIFNFNQRDASGLSKMSTNSQQFVYPIFAKILLTMILTCPAQITGRQPSFGPSWPRSCRIIFIHLCLLPLCSPAFIKFKCSLCPYPFICGLPCTLFSGMSMLGGPRCTFGCNHISTHLGPRGSQGRLHWMGPWYRGLSVDIL